MIDTYFMENYFTKIAPFTLPFKERLLRLALLMITLLCAGYALLFLITWPCPAAFINALFATFLFGSLYFKSANRTCYKTILPIFWLTSLCAISGNWIFSGGLYSGTGYIYLTVICFQVVISHRPLKYILFVSLTIINVLLLIGIEFYCPSIYPILTDQQLFLHSLYSLIATTLIITVTISLIKQEYQKEKLEYHQKKERLILANQSRSNFLATISHEIRTPLNGVLGMVSLLENTDPCPDQKEYAKTIKTSSKNLLKIVHKILDYSHIESGKITLQKERFSLRQCVEDAVNINSPKALEKELQLSFSIDENCPNTLLGDEGKLQQILINLIGNAIKFTEIGSIQLSISNITQTDKTIILQFSIKDTGTGIPNSKIETLFKPFAQIEHAANNPTTGTGLGLAISKRLVELMQGSIRVESHLNKGSTFHFTASFDCIEDTLPINKTVTEPLINPTLSIHHPLQILLVEDDKINRMVLHRLLEKMGYHPQTAINGQDALDKLQLTNFDVVLMDIQMPIMDGLETTKIIRQHHSHQPTIIAITANAMAQDKVLCQEAGMDDFLSKPINFHSLEQTLIKWKK